MATYFYVWSKVLLVSLSGFLLGYDAGSLNGVQSMVGYRQTLDLPIDIANDSNATSMCASQDDSETATILGLIVALLSVGCLFGALFAGVFSDFAGRKAALLVGAAVVACGGLLHTAAVNIWMPLLGRIIGGLGLGVLLQVTPLYIAEISPERQRGRLLTFPAIYQILGFQAGTVINLIIKEYLFGWRISLGVQLMIGIILVMGVILLPNSPRILVKKGKEEKALKILTKIYKSQDTAETQLKAIKSVVNIRKDPFMETLKYILKWKIFKRLLLGFFMMFLGRLSGLNFLTYFSVSILCAIGLPGFAASVGLAGTAIIALIVSLFVIDKLGRKPLLLIGLSGMFVCYVLSAGLILGFELESSTAETITTAQRVVGYFVLIIICVLLGFGTLSVGNIPWVVIGEMFPLKGRGFMISISNIGFWSGLILVNQTASLFISSPLNISGTLFFYAAMTFGFLLYILFLLPETKGHTLESIEELFSRPWSKRVRVLYYLRCACFAKKERKAHDVPIAHGLLMDSLRVLGGVGLTGGARQPDVLPITL